jgi:uncharacterized protein YggE
MTTPPTVAVRGEVTREVPPEIASVQATVHARAADKQVALRQLTERIDAVRQLLAGHGDAVEKQETAWVSVQPEYSGDRRPRIIGYVGTATIAATTGDFSRLGDLLVALASLEETSVAGPFWALRPDSPAHRQARHDALHAAIDRARDYAAALGATLVSLVEISDAGLSTQVTRPLAFAGYAARESGGAPQLNLDPQPQSVYASVEARFTISEPLLP